MAESPPSSTLSAPSKKPGSIPLPASLFWGNSLAARAFLSLAQEREVYEQHRPALIAAGHLGRWAVIRGESLLGIFGTIEEAMAAGDERYGADAVFMACQVAHFGGRVVATMATMKRVASEEEQPPGPPAGTIRYADGVFREFGSSEQDSTASS